MALSRLFVALPVPAAVTAQLTALPRKGLDARWAHPDDLHITLRFLGDCTDSKLTAVQDALRQVRRPIFHIDINGLGVFDQDHKVILHAHIESVHKITTLCAEITDRLTPLGFDFGFRPYVPHITLARLNGRRGLEAYIDRYGAGLRGHWGVDSFGLMRSAAPDEGGRRYTMLERYGLSPKG